MDSLEIYPRDRPVLKITPQMIDAGEEVLSEYLGDIGSDFNHIRSLLCSLYNIPARAWSCEVAHSPT